MKKTALFIVVLAAFPLVVAAYSSPGKPQGYVNDFGKVLSDATVQSLDSKLGAFEASTRDQISVVTIHSFGSDETIDSYAVKLFQEWGIGQKGKDNGILVLVSVGDRQVRIEVGYGLEGVVTDLQSSNIIQNVMLPAFRNTDYNAGISGAVDALIGVISDAPDAAQYSTPLDGGTGQGTGSGVNVFAIFFIVIMVLNLLARVLGKTKSWWLGGVIGAVVGAVIGLIWGFIPLGVIAIILLTIGGLIFDYIVSNRPPGSGGKGGTSIWPIFFGGGRGGGFGGSGGSGGGFGGFGGGMSGGGGASGRW